MITGPMRLASVPMKTLSPSSRVAAPQPPRQSAEGAGHQVAAGTDDPGLTGGDAAVGMVEEDGVADLGLRVDVRLVVASPQLGDGARQQGHRAGG